MPTREESTLILINETLIVELYSSNALCFFQASKTFWQALYCVKGGSPG